MQVSIPKLVSSPPASTLTGQTPTTLGQCLGGGEQRGLGAQREESPGTVGGDTQEVLSGPSSSSPIRDFPDRIAQGHLSKAAWLLSKHRPSGGPRWGSASAESEA